MILARVKICQILSYIVKLLTEKDLFECSHYPKAPPALLHNIIILNPLILDNVRW